MTVLPEWCSSFNAQLSAFAAQLSSFSAWLSAFRFSLGGTGCPLSPGKEVGCSSLVILKAAGRSPFATPKAAALSSLSRRMASRRRAASALMRATFRRYWVTLPRPSPRFTTINQPANSRLWSILRQWRSDVDVFRAINSWEGQQRPLSLALSARTASTNFWRDSMSR